MSFRDGDRELVWFPGKPNEANLGGPLGTLDRIEEPVPLPAGLLSRDGWHLIDDSGSPLLTNDWVQQRPGGGEPPEGVVWTWNRDLDWYLFAYGRDYKDALRALMLVSGRTPMPRKHVLGSWYSRWYPYDADGLLKIDQEYREHDFPLDVLAIDMDWHTQNARYGFGRGLARENNLGWTGYTWNRKLIQEPQRLLSEMRNLGVAVALNDHPADGIRDHEQCYPEFMQKLGAGTLPNPPFNAGDPRYMKALFESAHEPLEKQGVDFWWVDWQQDHVLPSVLGVPGLGHLRWLNYLYYNHSERNGRRGQSFSRWGGWGDHRHPIHFSGGPASTWTVLAFEVRLTVASGNAGCFFWAHDVGGFRGERDAEMFTRWVQFGAFSAALRLHSDDCDRDRPWQWDRQFQDAMQAAYHLRAQLFPYIYGSARQCYDDMVPLLRPMYLEYPQQEESYAYDGQYLLGDSVLVAPIVKPGEGPKLVAQQTVWFPAGVWYNVFTGERIVGNQSLLVTADISEVPVYVRAGFPLAMQPRTQRMSTSALSTLIIRCYPGIVGEAELYEDDGQTQGYARGECAWTRLRYASDGERIHIRVDPVRGEFAGQVLRRGYRIELPNTNPAAAATISARHAGVEYEEERLMNVVSFADIPTTEPLEVTIMAAEVDPSLATHKAARRRGL